MIQFVIVRLTDGHCFVCREVDAKHVPLRDFSYGMVKLPPYESEVLGEAAMRGRFTAAQSELVKQLALPIFPENCDADVNEGEEWKQ